jgi:acyl carrier protein
LALKIGIRTNGSIGNPFKSINYTYDEDGTLIISGSSICKRIISLDNESLSREESVIRCIKTNDLIKTINGENFIVGRKSDVYIGENGENISPDIIQNELEVKSANRFCVLEIEGKLSIVLEYDKNLPYVIINNEIDKIKNALAKIALGQYVSEIFVTYEPIANPNAIKVSRALLRKKIAENEVILRDYKKPNGDEKGQNNGQEDATMSVIRQAFKNALDTDEDVQSNDDFFLDLEGDSLGYFSLIHELERIYNIQFNLERYKSLRTPGNFYKYLTEVL